ncbi:RNA-directed DNA polymerase, eukaryota, Reverse transcriptase zinc-binding domain protein [Artemisia annua]|uniref:RNA-directed DNA polymerase, eukaryota, Reverse transcriptase zinc-binding domain protein n=1 Tax=Artemisia annua TaxID=35608 RepID=A0A2U1PQC0_ARTAN|nr:RNA-directed DNA polymerase, eukaryota, Reverse transcriptase zinc-binding domain protein [Artemisia annua]
MRNNFFIGGDLGEKEMTWVSWKKCMSSKKSSVLGIGSIMALNTCLLFKWIWHMLKHPYDLWAIVIKELHGHNGGIFDVPSFTSCYSPWYGIMSSVKTLKQKGIDVLSLCIRKLGNGTSIRFLDDIWCGHQPLKIQFPRVFMLDNDKSCCISSRLTLDDWSNVLRKQPRGGIESHQFSELEQLIGTVELSEHMVSLSHQRVP